MLKEDALKKIEYYCEKDKSVICPFSNEKCSKVSRSQIGVCSFVHQNKEQIICPKLFLKSDYFSIIFNKLFNSNSFTVLKEVKLNSNFIDFVLVDKNNNNNYCAVEVQTLDTSGNYKWVFGEKVKPFCINWKTTKKTIISQLLEKVPIFSKNGKKLVLVIQDTFFDYCGFSNNEYDQAKDIHVLKLSYHNHEFVSFQFSSYYYNDLLNLFKTDDDIDLDRVIKKYI